MDGAHRQQKLHGPSTLAVPGHLTLTKFIKAPAVGPKQRDRVIQFEAAQNIPYPLDLVAWDHLVIAEDGLDIEIMLTAVKLQVMENLCSAAESAGMPVKRAVSSCLALYRAFRFNYPGVHGPVMVVDSGARSTNLVMVGSCGRFFARTFPLAGNAITAAVAEELKLDFAPAEALKIQVLAGRAGLPAESPAPAVVQRAVGSFVSRLQLEITRTVGHYCWRTGDGQPTAVYLTGGSSLVAELGPALAEKFKLPVERYDPLRNVELSERARAAGAASATHLLANLIGLAVPAATKAESESGLLPPAIRAARSFRRRQPRLLGAAGLAALALVPPTELAQTAELRAQLPALQATAAANATNLEKIATARRQLGAFQGLLEARSSWVNFLADLQGRLANVEDVWLDQLAVVRPPAPIPAAGMTGGAPPARSVCLKLDGRLLDPHHPVSKVSPDSYQRVKQLLASIASSPFVAAIQNEHFDNSQPGLLRFDVTLVVNPQHPL